MFEKAANVDEINVTYAAERLAARHSQVRLLVVLADGMTRGSVESLAAAVDSVEHSGTTVVGIGIGDATVEAAYSRHRVVARPEALTEAMVGGVRSALRKSIALAGGDTWWGHESALYDDPSSRSFTNV
jgi:cobalamin biosynthesis protein CobT